MSILSLRIYYSLVHVILSCIPFFITYVLHVPFIELALNIG